MYSSVLVATEGMNERYKDHMRAPSLDVGEIAVVLMLAVVVDVAERL